MSGTNSSAGGRLGWLDASRVLAALGVIMIHCSADPAGNAFNAYPVTDRIFPVMMRMVGEISGAELFLVFSLFMLAMKVDKPGGAGYGATIRTQANRLLLPYLVWSLFYLAFRFVKADAFGYTAGLAADISDPKNWPGYVFTGAIQYHLHFLPTLFFIVLFYPIMKSAIRFPLVGLTLVPLLYFMETMQERAWGLLHDPVMAEFVTRIAKDIGYVGYGFAAFSLFGIWRRGIAEDDSRVLFRLSVCLACIAFLTTLAYAANVIMAGTWVIRPGASFYAHLYMPVLIFAVFLTARTLSWSPIFTHLAKLNFGIYLIHPVFIDLYEIGSARLDLHMGPAGLVTTKYLFATICAIAAAFLMSKIPPLAWTIGAAGGAPRQSRRLAVHSPTT